MSALPSQPVSRAVTGARESWEFEGTRSNYFASALSRLGDEGRLMDQHLGDPQFTQVWPSADARTLIACVTEHYT